MHVGLVQWVFYVFCGLTVLSALMVVLQNHPVRSVLCLVTTFFTSAVLWLMLQAEFLSLILLLVYVGAVMTLFLFVVMMLHVDVEAMGSHLLRLLPLGGVIVGGVLAVFLYVWSNTILPNDADLLFNQGIEASSAIIAAPIQPVSHGISNTQAIGQVLYTDYVYPFEIAAIILLVAMIAAITLVHREQARSKKQDVRDQIMTMASERIRLVSYPLPEKKI